MSLLDSKTDLPFKSTSCYPQLPQISQTIEVIRPIPSRKNVIRFAVFRCLSLIETVRWQGGNHPKLSPRSHLGATTRLLCCCSSLEGLEVNLNGGEAEIETDEWGVENHCVWESSGELSKAPYVLINSTDIQQKRIIWIAEVPFFEYVLNMTRHESVVIESSRDIWNDIVTS